MLEAFEQRWAEWNGLPSLGLSSWAGGALAALEFAGVRGETVLCPSNTFMATPLAAIKAGAEVEFVDCNRDDLCMSFEDFEAKAERHRPKAAILVHIGGHIAFDAERIAAYCRDNGIFLLEDCAHAHGADWNGRRPGGFGDAGVYSLYATKTVSTGEGGVLVSADPELIEFARKFRNYGKFEHEVDGLNFRMSEFTAALGLVQAERMEEIVAWKNDYAREHLDPLHPARLELPDGMTSGLYKYIVFDEIEKSTGARLRGAVPPDHGPLRGAAEHRLGGGEPLVRAALLPPRRAEPRHSAGGGSMRVLVTGGGGFIGSHVVDRLIERGITPRIFDLSASPYHSPLEVETFTGSITDPANLDLAMRDCDAVIHLAAVADVGPRPRRPGPRRGGQHARHAQRAGGGLPGEGRPRRLRLDHLGLQRLRRAGGRRGDADPGAAPPLHRDQAGRGDLLRRLRRAL